MAVAGTIAGLIVLFAAIFGVTIRGWIILAVYLLLGIITYFYLEFKRKTDPELYTEIELTPDNIRKENDLTSIM